MISPQMLGRNAVLALFVGSLAWYLVAIWWGLPDAFGPDRTRPWGHDELAPRNSLDLSYTLFRLHQPTTAGFTP